jgi:transcriptional regulator NrdR family protein
MRAKKKPVPAEPTKGLVCPKCECRHFHVVEVSPLPEGKIRRRRECRHCGFRISTTEAAANDPARNV